MELTFFLSGEDAERLLAIREIQGRKITANELAEELLAQELHRLFPPAPRYNEAGELTNGDAYRG